MKIICDDKAFDVKEGVALRDALSEIMPNDAIAARYNNEIASLNQPIDKEGKIEFINRKTKDGRDIYIRGLIYLASMAAERAYPGSKFNVNYQLSNAMFCQFSDIQVTDEVAINIKTEWIILLEVIYLL